MVSIPPREPASANRSKVVEGDVEIERNKPERIGTDSGARRGEVVGDACMQLPAPAQEQQAVDRSLIRSPIFSTSPRWLCHFEEPHHRSNAFSGSLEALAGS